MLFSSGMAAISTALMALLKSGDHIVSMQTKVFRCVSSVQGILVRVCGAPGSPSPDALSDQNASCLTPIFRLGICVNLR